MAALTGAAICLPINSATMGGANAFAPRLVVDLPLLRDGDIVLRRGLDMMSRLVLTQGESARFSHVGVIVVQDNVPYVIHAMPAEGQVRGGAILEPFTKFVSSAEAAEVAIYRSAHLNEAQRAAIRQAAFTQLGLPFDERFELSNKNKVYCTGLVVRAYAGAGLELVGAGAKIEVPLLSEPVIPPDHLRRFAALPLRLVASFAP